MSWPRSTRRPSPSRRSDTARWCPSTRRYAVRSALQTLLGFALLTAVISWLLQVYPALGRRRALARQLSIMAATGTVDFVREGQANVVVQLLQGLVDHLSTAPVDLVQYGESY